MNTHVVLVNLNRIAVPAIAPYAIDILGSALTQAGHRVDVVDLCTVPDPIAAIHDYFSSHRPDLTCLTMRNAGDLYFPSLLGLSDRGSFLDSHRTLIDAITQHVTADAILMGGVGFSINPEGFLARFGLRYGVRGRGERVLCDLAGRTREHRLPALARGAGTFIFDGRDDLPHGRVQRTHVDNRWYYEHGGQAAIRTTAGCAMRCSYCTEPAAVGLTYRKRAIENALDELDQLVAMGIKDVQTADSEFNMPLAHSKQLLKAIAARGYGRDFRLWAYCQPRPFDEEYARLLARAGVRGVNFGTDHTDADVLAGLGKWYGLEHIAQTTRWCQDHGIAVMHELLFGHPGDTPARMYRALDDIRALEPWVTGVTVGLGVFPESPLGRMWEARGEAWRSAPGFYCVGEPLVDPTFYVDAAFRVPDVFDDLRRHVGREAPDVMLPTIASTSSTDNQLVNSDRVRHQLQVEKRKGPSWYHFRETSS